MTLLPKYWMISNRNIINSSPINLGSEKGPLSFWINYDNNWQNISRSKFKKILLMTINTFPHITNATLNEDQQNVTFFIHGYNNTYQDAIEKYRSLCANLFNKTGIGILFNWPSNGNIIGYLADREDAELCSKDFADILCELYDWEINANQFCHTKISIIAHSMGNYLLQKAMQVVWNRKNQPLLMSLINQLIMVAADVDNDLFKSGEYIDKSDGDAMANLIYRITSLYSGLDVALGMSAGLKHFGKRRLGRSGLDRNQPLPDNVWDIDCSQYFSNNLSIHSMYFEKKEILAIMEQVLRGIDRTKIVI